MGQTVSRIGETEQNSAVHRIWQPYTAAHHTLNTPMSSFAHVDCVSGKELSGLFDNTRHNWIVFAPMKEGAPLFDSSFLQ
jgi:hypothetical protein